MGAEQDPLIDLYGSSFKEDDCLDPEVVAFWEQYKSEKEAERVFISDLNKSLGLE